MSDGRTAAGRQAKDPPRSGAEAPGTGPLSGAKGDDGRPADEWAPLALARDAVIRRRGGSQPGAAEWLRQAAINRKVRVRFAERYYPLEPSKGARYEALRSTGPRTDEEKRFVAGYTPTNPLDALRDRPDSM